MRCFYRILTIRRPCFRLYYLVTKVVPARIPSSARPVRCESSNIFLGFMIHTTKQGDVAGSQLAPGVDSVELLKAVIGEPLCRVQCPNYTLSSGPLGRDLRHCTDYKLV